MRKQPKDPSTLIFLLGMFFTACGTGAGEPPFSFGESEDEGPVRSTHLLHFDGNGNIAYRVEYPQLGLESLATVAMHTGAMQTEVFSDRWSISYSYDDAFNAFSRLPSSIRIETPSGGRINEYTLEKIVGNGLASYAGNNGRIRVIDITYFEIAGSGIPGMGGVGGFGGIGGFGGVGSMGR